METYNHAVAVEAVLSSIISQLEHSEIFKDKLRLQGDLHMSKHQNVQ